MEIGVEDLAGAQHRALDSLGFLHLDDHLGAREHFGGGGDDGGAGPLIERVMRANALTRAGLDQNRMAMGRQFMDALGGQADAIFVILDFLDGADDHETLSILQRDGPS